MHIGDITMRSRGMRHKTGASLSFVLRAENESLKTHFYKAIIIGPLIALTLENDRWIRKGRKNELPAST